MIFIEVLMRFAAIVWCGLPLAGSLCNIAHAETYVYKDVLNDGSIAFLDDGREVIVGGTSYSADVCSAGSRGVCVLGKGGFIILAGSEEASIEELDVRNVSVTFSADELWLGQFLDLYKTRYSVGSDGWTTWFSAGRGLVAISLSYEGSIGLFLLKGRCGLGHGDCQEPDGVQMCR